MKNKVIKYQIALSSFDGVHPQKYEVYDSEDKANEVCNRYNSQDNNPYVQWVVIRKEYLA